MRQVAAAVDVDSEPSLGLLEHAIGLAPVVARLASRGFEPSPGRVGADRPATDRVANDRLEAIRADMNEDPDVRAAAA